MKIVVAGGSGQVGTVLARAFHRDGHEVVVLSRRPNDRPWRMVGWDGATLGNWSSELDGCDALINLTGRSVNCRYTTANRKEILESRVLSTRVLGQAVSQSVCPPRVWLQASTATIYAHRYDAPNDETTGILGGGEPNAPDTWKFSIEVARAWERAFDEVVAPRTRKVTLRSAMTMSPDAGGVFATLRNLARCGFGGRAGDGRQFVSWIHYRDFIAAVRWLLEHDDLGGIVNVAAPEPLPNADFMRLLREAAGIPFGLPISNWMLEVGAFFMRTETELILKSRRVVPTRLLERGFRFEFPAWSPAARDLCLKWRA
jgi:uncharacterized protein (TIGR01777 family)